MIPDLQSSLLCDDVRQERNGKFMLIGIFDGLATQQIPTRFHRICVVNRWCSGQGTFQQRTRIVSPDGRTIVVEGKDVPVQLADTANTATSIEAFMNAEFKTEGTHWIEVLLDGNMRLRYPLILRKIDPPQQQF
jgi:hypothetical protein